MDIGLDIFAVLHSIVRRAVASLPGARRGSLLMLDGERLIYRAAFGFEDAASAPLRIPSDAGPASATPAFALSPSPLAARELSVVPAAEWYRAYPPAAPSAHVPETKDGAVLVLPVHLHSEPRGYLALEQASMDAPDDACRTILELLADSAGAALERRQLFEEKARSAQELRLLEEMLSAVTASVDLQDLIETIGYGVKSVLTRAHWSAVDLVILAEERRRLRVYRDPRRPITSYWNNVRDGALEAGRDLRVSVEFKAGTSAGGAAQHAMIDEAIRRKVAGIIVAPIEPVAMEPSIQRAADAGIPVITIDTPPVPGSQSLIYIGTDNIAAGRLAGEVMKRLLPAGGVIGVQVGLLQATNSLQRTEGFRAATAGGKMTVLPPDDNAHDADKGQELALAALRQRGDIQGAFGACGENGPCWGMAAKATGRAGDLKIVAFDLVPATIAMLREGVIHAAVVQREYDMGHRAVLLLHQMVTRSVAHTLAEAPAARAISTGVDVVTLERMPWSIALPDYLTMETARRVAERKIRLGVGSDRTMEILVIGMAGKGECVSEESRPFLPNSLLSRVVSAGQPFVVDPSADAYDGLSDVVEARNNRMRTQVFVPLIARDTVLGAILLASPEAGACSAEDLGLLERIAGTAAVAIENARLFRELTERTQELEREAQHQESLLQTIHTLGSPVVPVARGILVMPLVGAMDAERASRFIEAMLREISARRARVVLIDVTGAAMVDATTAQHLMRASRAAGLLGAEVVLVGIAPEAAQMMVNQGVDAGDLVTRSNLELGFAYALAKMKGRIVYER